MFSLNQELHIKKNALKSQAETKWMKLGGRLKQGE